MYILGLCDNHNFDTISVDIWVIDIVSKFLSNIENFRLLKIFDTLKFLSGKFD